MTPPMKAYGLTRTPEEEDIPLVIGDLVECAYRLERNTFREETRLQLMIEYAAKKAIGSGL